MQVSRGGGGGPHGCLQPVHQLQVVPVPSYSVVPAYFASPAT